jgi:hypothetical protein
LCAQQEQLNKDNSETSKLITAVLRFNEPIPLHIQGTLSLPYTQDTLSSQFLSPDARRGKRNARLNPGTLERSAAKQRISDRNQDDRFKDDAGCGAQSCRKQVPMTDENPAKRFQL